MAGLLCLKQYKQSSIQLSNLQIFSIPDEGNSRNVPDEGCSRNVPDEGNSRNVPDEGNSRNVTDEGNSRNVPDEGNSRNVPDEGNSRNASCALNWISTFLFQYKQQIKLAIKSIHLYYIPYYITYYCFVQYLIQTI